MRKALLALALLLPSTTIAQNLVSKIQPNAITQNGILISSRLESCESVKNGTSKEYFLLSFSNENSYRVRVTFKRNLWYNGKCNSCDSQSPEHTISLELEPYEKAEGSCAESSGLRIFSRMLNLEKVSKLTYFELTNIEVDEVK
ncbi:MAG: hypothetical protein K9G41_05905 [Flavobacteriales bacterium]|nr:hypothetical protein [Flavobacteriales bacterium]